MGTNTGREYLVMRNLSKATLQGLSALLGASRNLNDQLQQEEWATCLKDISIGRVYLVMRNLSKATLQGLSALIGASRNLN